MGPTPAALRGRSRPSLDDLRPDAWTAALTTERLELLWVLEATVAVQPNLNALLVEILASSLIPAADFPTPTDAERVPPGKKSETAQTEMKL